MSKLKLYAGSVDNIKFRVCSKPDCNNHTCARNKSKVCRKCMAKDKAKAMAKRRKHKDE